MVYMLHQIIDIINTGYGQHVLIRSSHERILYEISSITTFQL